MGSGSSEQGSRVRIRRDVLLLSAWASLLLATTFVHPSLMAYDEGNFAAEARFMTESGRWLARLWWGSPVYTHGVLLNWLMVVSFKIFGIGARAARLPSAIACVTAVLLTYDISRIITGKRIIGFLSAAVLMLFHLWFQYGHLATQDMLLVCLELFGIWGLLKAEAQPSRRIAWGFLSGLVLGLGFLDKSFMILLPAAALVPYLVFEQRRHRHLTNPGFVLGACNWRRARRAVAMAQHCAVWRCGNGVTVWQNWRAGWQAVSRGCRQVLLPVEYSGKCVSLAAVFSHWRVVLLAG